MTLTGRADDAQELSAPSPRRHPRAARPSGTLIAFRPVPTQALSATPYKRVAGGFGRNQLQSDQPRWTGCWRTPMSEPFRVAKRSAACVLAVFTVFWVVPDSRARKPQRCISTASRAIPSGRALNGSTRLADGTFSIGRNSAGGVSFSLTAPDSSFWWTADFSTPGNAPPVPGTYEPATRFPLTVFAGLAMVGGGRSCDELTGRYVVLEAVYAPDGAVQRFAADLEQHCEDADPALFAAIRYNSTIADTSPFGGSYPRYELHFSVSEHGRLEGYGINCAGGSTCSASWGAPLLAVITAIPAPGYTFTGWTGACNGFRVLNVHVNSPKTCGATFGPIVPTDPRTLLLWHSAPGEYIGQGHANVYAASNSIWTVQSTGNGNGVDIVIKSIANTSQSEWHLQFKAPPGEPLGARAYAYPVPADSPSTKRLDVFGNGRHCLNVQGIFVRTRDRVPTGHQRRQLARDRFRATLRTIGCATADR